MANTVQELGPLFESVKAGEWKKAEERAAKVAELETAADALHRDVILAISRASFFAGFRDPFLRLSNANDKVADAAQNSAQILIESKIDPNFFLFLYEEPKCSLNDLFNSVKATVRLLQESISALRSDTEIAFSKCLLVKRSEEEADEIKDRLIKRILAHKAELDVLTLLQLRDFVVKVDKIADASEDCSDLVISLVAKAEA